MHDQPSDLSVVLSRMADEAREFLDAKDLESKFMEMLDVIGWLEVAARSLSGAHHTVLMKGLQAAVHFHRLKCNQRGLRMLRNTYEFVNRIATGDGYHVKDYPEFDAIDMAKTRHFVRQRAAGSSKLARALLSMEYPSSD